MRVDLEEIARKTHEAFSSLLLMRDFHGSSDSFQEHFKDIVAHLRARARSLDGRDDQAAGYYTKFAEALEAWNYVQAGGRG